MRNRKLVQALCVAGVAAATTMSGTAAASGFALVEQSVKQVGSAIAGGAASAEDATTIFFNPAGMMRLDGKQYVLAGHVVVPSSKFTGSATTNPALPVGGNAPISGGLGGDAGGPAFVPNFYYMRDLSETMKFGFGVNVPFGLTTDYDDGWVGRYHALKSELKTVNLNPSIAYRVNDKLSLGAGISAMFAEATLTNAVDYSTSCFGLPGGLAAGCGAAGLATPGSPATDGAVSVNGDDWGFGLNLGLLYEVSAATRVGIAYRSSVEQKVEGTADFTAPTGLAPSAQLTALNAALADTAATAKVELPETVSLSVLHQLNSKWDLMADVTWTKWSRFDELRIQFANPLKADTVQPENWDDTYKYSVGVNYRHNNNWTWRGGVAFDQTPVPNAADRTPRIPDEDRTWLAVGFTYVASASMTFDFAFAHLLVDDPAINTVDASFGHILSGTYEADVNIVSAQLTWSF